MKRLFSILFSLSFLFYAEVCYSDEHFSSEPTVTIMENQISLDNMKIQITVGTDTFIATLLDNETTRAFREMLPMTVNMWDVNQNEKSYILPISLSQKASNPRTIHNGDLMLWRTDTLVLFYKTFTTPYSYTLLGSVTNPLRLEEALGSDNVMVTFALIP